MQNLLNNKILLAFTVIILTQCTYNNFAKTQTTEQPIPFDRASQAFLNNIARKLNENRPNDYKGYTAHNVPYCAHHTTDKKIILNDKNLHLLSKKELKFLLGREILRMRYDEEKNDICDQATKRALINGNISYYCSLFTGMCLGGIIGYEPNQNPSSHDIKHIETIIGSCAGIMLGSLIGTAIETLFCNPTDYIKSDLKKAHYKIDKELAEKLDCYQDGIKFYQKYNNHSTANYKEEPSPKEHIAHLKKSFMKKQQQTYN